MPQDSLAKGDAPRIYLLPGMTADYPVYRRLAPLLTNASIVSFVAPLPNEELAEYAARMAPQFNPDCYIGGVSFGGILALEISRLVRPKGCIVISSVQGPRQLPPWMRIGRAIGGRRCSHLLRWIGDAATLVPRRVRSDATIRVVKLAGVDGQWHRWATSAVLDWRPNGGAAFPILHIHGDADRTFPIQYVSADIVVRAGGHGLPVSHPVEVANAINAFTRAA